MIGQYKFVIVLVKIDGAVETDTPVRFDISVRDLN